MGNLLCQVCVQEKSIKSRIKYRFLIVGNSGVGKTSIINQLISREFSLSTQRTEAHQIQHYQQNTMLIEISGKNQYIEPFLLPLIDGIIYVYAVNDINSLQSLQYWRKLVTSSLREINVMKRPQEYIFANKTDLVEHSLHGMQLLANEYVANAIHYQLTATREINPIIDQIIQDIVCMNKNSRLSTKLISEKTLHEKSLHEKVQESNDSSQNLLSKGFILSFNEQD